jgi:hypothetical protein
MTTEIIEKMVYPFTNVIYRFNQGRKRNFSIKQVILVTLNIKIVAQIFNNFTRLYGSRWKAIQKINELYVPQYETAH